MRRTTSCMPRESAICGLTSNSVKMLHYSHPVPGYSRLNCPETRHFPRRPVSPSIVRYRAIRRPSPWLFGDQPNISSSAPKPPCASRRTSGATFVDVGRPADHVPRLSLRSARPDPLRPYSADLACVRDVQLVRVRRRGPETRCGLRSPRAGVPRGAPPRQVSPAAAFGPDLNPPHTLHVMMNALESHRISNHSTLRPPSPSLPSLP